MFENVPQCTHLPLPISHSLAWPPSHSHILSASLRNKLAFPECTRTNPPQGAVQMPRKITTSLWQNAWLYFSVSTKIDRIAKFKRSEGTHQLVVAHCIAWLYFSVIWMEIWLGQDPLQIVGSFVVQLSKPDNQANLIHISLDIRGSLKQSVYGSLEFKKSLWKSSQDF